MASTRLDVTINPALRTVSWRALIIRIAAFLFFLALVLWAVVQLYPLIWMVLSALKSEGEITLHPLSLPTSLHFENFVDAWTGGGAKIPIGHYFVNSVIVTTGSLVLLLTTAALAGYGLARYRLVGNRAYFGLLVLLTTIPSHALIIPVFFLLGTLDLRNNYLGLILAYVALGLPFSVVLLRSFFQSFPGDLIDAALLDGCSQMSAFWRVVLPMSRGSIAAVGINNVVWIWNELLFALMIMNRVDMKTLPLGVIAFRGQYAVDWRLTYSALTIASLPPLLLFFIFQRQIIKGFTTGALK